MPDSIADAGWRFDNSYARLPEPLFAAAQPVPVRSPAIVIANEPLAAELGLDPTILQAEGAGVFAGNEIPRGAEPIALAYAGHQFGHFTNLGDGRAILLGEQISPIGRRYDIQLKGAGRTRYSRGGDGRAAIGPMHSPPTPSAAMPRRWTSISPPRTMVPPGPCPTSRTRWGGVAVAWGMPSPVNDTAS